MLGGLYYIHSMTFTFQLKLKLFDLDLFKFSGVGSQFQNELAYFKLCVWDYRVTFTSMYV